MVAPFNRTNISAHIILTAFYHHEKDSWLNCQIQYEESFDIQFLWKGTPYWIDHQYHLKNNFYLIKDAMSKGFIHYAEIDKQCILIVPVSNESINVRNDKQLIPDFSVAIPLIREML